MTDINRQYLLAQRPVGLPGADTFEFKESPIAPPGENEIQIRVIYASLDPAMRGWMMDQKSYVPPVGIGEVMRAGALGVVTASNDPNFAVGDHVIGMLGIQQVATGTRKALNLQKAQGVGSVPLPRLLGALGMPGMTAYFGLLEVGKPVEGDTVVVSGAAGAVGSVVGQIAKIKGCRAVGIAGGPDKCKMVVEELGFDACIDYKSQDVRSELRKHCPDGINVYFDNVGGEILDAALANLTMHARVVICGAISQYNNTDGMRGPANYLSLLVNRATMQGMVVFDWADRYAEAGMAMGQWMMQGKLEAREHIVEGIENFPEALLMLFDGRNQGKLILKIGDE